MAKSDKDAGAKGAIETTGHEWDGIEELDTPMPRWWLIIFYATIIWAIGYWIAMPAWPGIKDYTKGILGMSDRANVAHSLAELQASRGATMKRLGEASSLESIRSDDELLQLALVAGKSAFGDNCATCHGQGGGGAVGYPNLNDDVWLWGGTLNDIRQTITYGIRSGHDKARFSQMPSFGVDGLLTRDQIFELVEYVFQLSGRESEPQAATRGAKLFADNCVVCHGAEGKGDRTQGAPDLTDRDWLYGSDRASIYNTIWYARNGVMPNWNDRLSPEMINALTIYVHSLGGGEG